MVRVQRPESNGYVGEQFRVLTLFCDYLPEVGDVPEWIWKLSGQGIHVVLVLLDNPGPLNKCWTLLKKGIYDILIWEGIDGLIRRLQNQESRWQKVQDILDSDLVKNNLVGNSLCWKRFLGETIQASLFSKLNIMLHGESGTGKELLSRLIHSLDERPEKGKLILVDCTTIVPELSGSEFFGHEKGSYTSAVGAREGAFALADKGTLFLDEISELPLPLQAELLRVIQEKTYKRVGSNLWKKTEFRLICATNKDLRELVMQGKFRQDLFYRITDIELNVPSLRDHPDDIGSLAVFFLSQYFREKGAKEIPEFDPSVINFIQSKSYAGNVRELRQLIRRIAMNHVGGNYISLGCVPREDRPTGSANAETVFMDELEYAVRKAVLAGVDLMDIKNSAAFLAVKVAMNLDDGDKQRASERLNITLRAVQQYTKKHHLSG